MEGHVFSSWLPFTRQIVSPFCAPTCQEERAVRQLNQADDFAFTRGYILAQGLDDVDIEQSDRVVQATSGKPIISRVWLEGDTGDPIEKIVLDTGDGLHLFQIE